MRTSSDPQERVWITMRQIANRLSVSIKWVRLRMQSDPTFPKPIMFGDVNRFYFLLEEIQAWELESIRRSRPDAA